MRAMNAPRNRQPRERYLVVPAFLWQEQHEILLQGLKIPKMFKTARLSCKEGEYYLSVNVACEYPQTIRAETYLGITRGLSWCGMLRGLDRDGTLVAGRKSYQRKSFRSKNEHARPCKWSCRHCAAYKKLYGNHLQAGEHRRQAHKR